jgi:hypothetical protein
MISDSAYKHQQDLVEKQKKERLIEDIKSLGDVSTYLSAYGNPRKESLWVKISEVRLKAEEIISKLK